VGHVVAVLEELVIMVTALVRNLPRQLGVRGALRLVGVLIQVAFFPVMGLLLANAEGPAGFAHGRLNAPVGWFVFSVGVLFLLRCCSLP